MRAADVSHAHFLDLQPDDGLIRFAGARAVLIGAAALGQLRRFLVENVGQSAGRAVLTQFGYTLGANLADAAKAHAPWISDERHHGGLRLHALAGLFHVEPPGADPLAKEGFVVLGSFEAEQQLSHLGRSTEPSCWTVGGLISGYLSRATLEPYFALETRCVSMGHAACRFTVRRREDWGAARAEELRAFDAASLQHVLDASLEHVAATLKATEDRLHARRKALEGVAEDSEPDGVIARSPPMKALVELVRRIARVDATLLITGESGTGKERIARLVHDESARAAGPFVAVNCGAITETLLESELFGHARGAFTGASHERAGLFEGANGGTLLLDEVGEVSPGMQVKLLRVLQEREVRRVGENKSRRIDVRVVAATNRDLVHGVAGGAFRRDLYYRLKVVEVHVPALRERAADILPLAHLLLGKAAERMKRPVRGFSPEAAELLMQYAWPGNVRELENAVERAVALMQGTTVEVRDLPEELRVIAPAPVSHTGVRPLADIEKDYIVAALDRNGGNQTHTAAQLRIGSATLYRKLRSYGLTTPRTPGPKH